MLRSRHDNRSPKESLATTIRAECPPDKTVKEFLGGEGSFLAKVRSRPARKSELPPDDVENQDLTMQKLDLAIANDVKYQHLAQRQFVDRDPVILDQATNVTVSLSAR